MLLRTRLAVPIALASALLLPAAPAAAHGDDDYEHPGKHHRKHYGHYRGHGHHHHPGCGHGGYYAPRYVVRNHFHGYPVYRHDYAPAAYCGPCGNYFDSYDDLSYHVHHHHHIAVLQLPFVIFQASIGGGAGWVFGH
jgi:hypothetical protein